MDVTLLLTHRCNLACTYCYAGEHHGLEMGEATLRAGVGLLYADDAAAARLSFFGGEPFLAFDRMLLAAELARRAAAGRTLELACTTNGTLLGPRQVDAIAATGMRVTVSIDGVREAHDEARRFAGGAPSFAAAVRGLRRLLAARLRPEVAMVVTPATAPFLFRSVRWLLALGVERVHANLDLAARWSLADREVLREELIAAGRELLARRLRGEDVWFAPFGFAGGRAAPVRRQIVVGADGSLYACAPLVGDGRAPQRRLGGLGDGAAAIVARAPAACDGGDCACMAYLETGDLRGPGANGIWYGRVCREIGAAVVAGLDEAARRASADGLDPRRLVPRARTAAALAIGLALGAGGLAFTGDVVYELVAPAPRRLVGPRLPHPAPSTLRQPAYAPRPAGILVPERSTRSLPPSRRR